MAETQEVLLQKIKEQGDIVRKLKAAKESSEKVNLLTNFTILFLGVVSIKLKLTIQICNKFLRCIILHNFNDINSFYS